MKERAGVKLSSWPEIGSDGDVLLTPYVPKGITEHDDDDDDDDEIKVHLVGLFHVYVSQCTVQRTSFHNCYPRI